MTTPPRILLVDDDHALRDAVAAALRGQGYEVATAVDGTAGTTQLAAFLPDLAVLEVRLPAGPDGFDLARAIRAGGDLPIIFVSGLADLDHRLAGFAAGGDDYLVKPFATEELVARIQALLRRSGRLESRVWQVDDLVVDEAARIARRGGSVLELTRTEFDLLVTLGRNRGTVVAKSRLLGLVWGFESYDENLVEVHVSALRRKLEVGGERLIHTVRGVGYVLRA